MAKLRMEILLRQMFDSGASDLLLTVGRPPQFRIHGSMGLSEAIRCMPKIRSSIYTPMVAA